MNSLLRQCFRPEPDNGRPPPHLSYINNIFGPRLQLNLNVQLRKMGRASTLPTAECGHCGGLSPDGLRIQQTVISGSLADRIGWLTIHMARVPLHSDYDFMLELNVSTAPLAAEAESAATEPCLALSDTAGFYRLLLGWSARCRHRQRRELPAAACETP